MNVCGGQAVGISEGILRDPVFNTARAMPALQYGAAVATERGLSGYDWFNVACQNSGHPGLYPKDDSLQIAIFETAMKLIFNADGSWAVWPLLPGELPEPEHPTQEWTELHALTLRLLQIQEQTQRSLELTRTLLKTAYGKASVTPLETLKKTLRNLL